MGKLKQGSIEAWKHRNLEAWKQGITRKHMESHVSPVTHGSMEV